MSVDTDRRVLSFDTTICSGDPRPLEEGVSRGEGTEPGTAVVVPSWDWEWVVCTRPPEGEVTSEDRSIWGLFPSRIYRFRSTTCSGGLYGVRRHSLLVTGCDGSGRCFSETNISNKKFVYTFPGHWWKSFSEDLPHPFETPVLCSLPFRLPAETHKTLKCTCTGPRRRTYPLSLPGHQHLYLGRPLPKPTTDDKDESGSVVVPGPKRKDGTCSRRCGLKNKLFVIQIGGIHHLREIESTWEWHSPKVYIKTPLFWP